MIHDLFTTTFTIERMSWSEDMHGNPYSELGEAGSFSGHLQQANSQLVQDLGLSFSKTFTVWCALETDVRTGDRLTAGASAYTVREKMDYFIGDNAHTELVVELNGVTDTASS